MKSHRNINRIIPSPALRSKNGRFSRIRSVGSIDCNLMGRLSQKHQWIGIALLCCCSVLPIQAIAAAAQKDPIKISKNNWKEAIQSPKNTIELLHNIKVVLDLSLLKKKEFYEEKAMAKIFNGIVEPWPYVQRGEMEFVVDESKSLYRGKNYHPSLLSVVVSRWETPDGLIKTELTLKSEEKGVLPDFEEVEKVFGKNWTEDPNPPQLWRMSSHPTTPHGNTEIIYRPGNAVHESLLVIDFDSTGTIYMLSYRGTDSI